MVARFLVTTALEDTWPVEDVPLLFLGESCRRYDRKSSWENRDAVVAPYHWDDRQKLHDDYLYLQAIYKELLNALAAQLNAFHRVDHSVRYWRILAGPWLGYFIQILFDRWFMLRVATSTYDIAGVRIVNHCPGEMVPNDMTDWTHPHPIYGGHLFAGDAWNELIYGQILEWEGFHVERIPIPKIPAHSGSNDRHISTRTRVRSVLSRALSFFSRPNDYFFISTYLSLRSNISLQFRLGQIPKLWHAPPPPWTKVNPDMRNWQLSLPETGHSGESDEFIPLLKKMIPMHIPTVYLEGYKDLVSAAERLPWPDQPKAIFDSISWNADDVFKTWAATKAETGTPLIIGQHGGNYGMALWNFNEDHQIAIADRFLTWGWNELGKNNITPVFNFKGFPQGCVADKAGVALMVEMTMPRKSYHMYSVPVAAGQWQAYFEEQCRFVQALPDGLRNQLLIRLCPQDYGLSQRQRWQARFPCIQLDDGVQPIAALLKGTRIYISTYNATTYLESLSLNFPTIIFWNPKHWELRESTQPYFEKLKAVGIFHETPESAAQQMAEVWNDVSGWWDSEEVQSVRVEFCERYARIIDKPIDVMTSLFCEIAKN